MEMFGIFSPVLGLRQDFPSILIDAAFTPDNENVVMRYGEIQRVQKPGEIFAVTPDGNPVLKYHWFYKSNGAGYLLAFTKDHIYYWDETAGSWSTKYTTSSSCTAWSVVSFFDKCIATNNVDKVLVWDGTGNFTELGSASGIDVGSSNYLTKAKLVTEFESYCLLADVTVDGTHYPHRIYWSDIQDCETWNSGDAGNATVPGADVLTGFGQLQNYLMVFKEQSIHRWWLISGDEVFAQAPVNLSHGTEAPDSIVNGGDGELYFFASDFSFRRMDNPMANLIEISRLVEPYLRNINRSDVPIIRGLFNRKYAQLMWAIPTDTDEEQNNVILCYDRNVWTKHDISASALAGYKQQTALTISDLDTLTNGGSIKDIPFPKIGDAEMAPDYRPDICGDYSGKSYRTNAAIVESDGSTYSGYFVLSTDLGSKKRLNTYKRLLRLRAYFRKEYVGTEEITVYLKRDDEQDWQEVGTMPLTDTPPWSSADTYRLGDTVEYNGSYWKSLRQANTNHTPAEGDWWMAWTDERAKDDIIMHELTCDYTAKHFLIKFAGSSPFRFLGCIFEFVSMGER